MARTSKSERENALERLRNLLKPGDTVYTVLLHRSRSGMSRTIQAVIPAIREDGKQYIHDLSADISRVLDYAPFDRDRGGVKQTGCGMDMGFHLVYSLSMTLFCPEKYDHDAAYSLKQEWL